MPADSFYEDLPSNGANGIAAEVVYAPSSEAASRCEMARFAQFIEARTAKPFHAYSDLHRFSVSESRPFWALLMEWLDLDVEGESEPSLVGDNCEDATFFPALRLNYVANLLRKRDEEDDARLALICWNEEGRTERMTRLELTRLVLQVATQLKAHGVRPGTRVGAIARNTADAVVACLASVSLGAVWCSASTDLGLDALRGRLGQFSPELVFYHSRHRFGGEAISIESRIRELIAELPELRVVIALDDESISFDTPSLVQPDFPRGGTADASSGSLQLDELPRLPFNHPLFVLFTSGTTGPPKGIVHGVGGTLLEHHKEHRLHTGLVPGDLLYFQTTCGWMMWNWTISALACRAGIALYDGVVVHPSPEAQLELVGRHEVTVLGTSPSFLQALRDSREVSRTTTDLPSLRLILSTGSVLAPDQFTWTRDHVKAIPIHSISGGTDIIGCFLLGNPTLAVLAGQLQCRSLGYAVTVVPSESQIHHDGDVLESGELVCLGPFPSRPLGLLNDPEGTRFHSTYFSQNAGVWTHGDLVEFTVQGGARLLGRSDGVLNVGGVRIGPAEIRHALESIPEVGDWVAVEQRSVDPANGSRIVLAVVLRRGYEFDGALGARIRKKILERCSAAHVPAIIVPVSELPVTHNGKRSDRAVRDAVNGDPIGNLEAIRNPRCLEELRGHPLLTGGAPEHHGLRQPDGRGPDTLGRVIAIWEGVLRLSVAADDDFFEIGGDSLRGLRVLNGVEREFGLRLPMSSLLFSGSNPAGMADLLEATFAGDPRSTIVPFHRSETGTPVFWIPGGGMMSVVAFRAISQRLGDRPVFGLEARLAGDPQSSLRELARQFVGAVLAAAPDGPHFLFGFSAGAFVAYEMAAQLRERGRTVGLIVLFDAHLLVQRSAIQTVSAIRQRAAYHASRMAKLPAGDWLPYMAGVGTVLRKRLYQRLFPEQARSWRHEVGETANYETAFDLRDRHNRRLVDEYRAGLLPRLDVRTAVVIAGRSSWSGVDPEIDPRFAWRRLVASEIEFLRIPGSHLSMLEEPEVDELGNALRDLLERTEAALDIAASSD